MTPRSHTVDQRSRHPNCITTRKDRPSFRSIGELAAVLRVPTALGSWVILFHFAQGKRMSNCKVSNPPSPSITSRFGSLGIGWLA